MSSAEPGEWHTLAYQRAILDAFCQPEVDEVVCMKSKRIGWTKIIGHVLGYHIHQDPASVLIVQPTEGDADDYSTEEIQPMISETPVLSDLVAPPRSRTGGNKIKKKSYPGGMLHMVGANAPRGFRRITVRVVLFDEVDGYPQTAGVEGDQIKLGMGRAENFWNRKFGIGSTPTLKSFSRIERHFNASSRGYPILTCPLCGGEHIRKFRQPAEPIIIRDRTLKVSHLHWEDDKPETAAWVCPDNGCVIDHSHHRQMVNGLWWFGEQWEWRDGDFTFLPGFAGRIGFHIWAGYSMSPNATPAKLATEFLEAKENTELLTVFVNTVLGETWEEEGETISGHMLMERCEDFGEHMPDAVRVLTMGVDVQADRLEAEVVGWGEGEESWSLDYLILPGDPSQGEVWGMLADIISARFPRADGASLQISRTFIDSGYLPKHVYEFCRKTGTHVVPTKGMQGMGRPIVETSLQRLRRLRKRRVQGVKPELIGADEGKLLLFRRLKLTVPGPGYCHFPLDRDQEYFEQLTAEKLVTRYRKGRPFSEWVQTRPRNEALDCRVLAHAALAFHGTDGLSQQPQPKQAAKPAPKPMVDESWLKVSDDWLSR